MLTVEEYLLVSTDEECAEVQQRISKALRFGLQEIEPGQTLTNEERIRGELFDLLALIELLDEHDIIKPPNPVVAHAAMDAKKAKVKKFMDYARQCGTLEPKKAS